MRTEYFLFPAEVNQLWVNPKDINCLPVPFGELGSGHLLCAMQGNVALSWARAVLTMGVGTEPTLG